MKATMCCLVLIIASCFLLHMPATGSGSFAVGGGATKDLVDSQIDQSFFVDAPDEPRILAFKPPPTPTPCPPPQGGCPSVDRYTSGPQFSIHPELLGTTIPLIPVECKPPADPALKALQTIGYYWNVPAFTDFDTDTHEVLVGQWSGSPSCQCGTVDNSSDYDHGWEWMNLNGQIEVTSSPDWTKPGVQSILFKYHDLWSEPGAEDAPAEASVDVNLTVTECGICQPELASRTCDTRFPPPSGFAFTTDTGSMKFHKRHMFDYKYAGASQGAGRWGSEVITLQWLVKISEVHPTYVTFPYDSGWQVDADYEKGDTILCLSTCEGSNRSVLEDNYVFEPSLPPPEWFVQRVVAAYNNSHDDVFYDNNIPYLTFYVRGEHKWKNQNIYVDRHDGELGRWMCGPFNTHVIMLYSVKAMITGNITRSGFESSYTEGIE